MAHLIISRTQSHTMKGSMMFMIKILLNICYITAILEQKFEQEY